MIEKRLFGMVDGKEVNLFKLTNGGGLSFEVISYGAILKNLVFKGVDVVLGRDTLEEYLDNDGYFGATIGRHANRIRSAKFTLNGKEYKLAENAPNVNIHGGIKGFADVVWDSEMTDGDEPSVKFSYHSPDGEEGYPGNLEVSVTYILTKENSVKLHYEAVCDKDTVCNLTNHSYFNLNGHDSGRIDDHIMKINADFFTPMDEYSLPTGEVISVKETVFDFTEQKKIKDGWKDDKRVTDYRGWDHNFALRGKGFRLAATAVGDKTGITMDTYTDLPGVQFYSGNFTDDKRVCKGGAIYGPQTAFCLETQFFPDAPNNSHFVQSILKAGEKFDSYTEFKFR